MPRCLPNDSTTSVNAIIPAFLYANEVSSLLIRSIFLSLGVLFSPEENNGLTGI